LDFHENLIKVERIAVTLMPAPKSPGVLRTKFDTPQPDRLVADSDTALGHKILYIAVAQIEAMIKPDNVLNDRGRKSVAFVQR
jgi:hypothetical protein